MLQANENRHAGNVAVNEKQINNYGNPSIARPGEPTPEAPVIYWMRSSSGHTRLVYIRCPYCSKRHQHGWRRDETTPGTRVAHCRNLDVHPTASYRVTITPATYEKAVAR